MQPALVSLLKVGVYWSQCTRLRGVYTLGAAVTAGRQDEWMVRRTIQVTGQCYDEAIVMI